MRDAFLDDGTIFFLYAPFTGPVLEAVLDRLRELASQRAIVVRALGIELDRARWLDRRDMDAFWLSIYDSRIPGVPERKSAAAALLTESAAAIAFDR